MTPVEHYSQRLRDREALETELDRAHARAGGARLVVAGCFVLAAGGYFATHAFGAIWLLVPIVVFIALLFHHQRIQSARSRARRAAAFYREGLARINDEWRTRGCAGAPIDVEHHVYAADLDLFGAGSLFALLCAARTQQGERTLAQWLLSPASLDEIHARHTSIRDLRERLALREDLAVQGDAAASRVNSEALIAWATAPDELESWIGWAAPLLACLAVATSIVWAFSGLSFPFILVLVIEAGVAYRLKKPIHTAISGIETAYEELKLLAALLHRIEREPFDAAPLRGLVDRLSTRASTASRTLSRLATVVNFVEARRNPLLAPLMLALMYPVLVALAAERWRTAHGEGVRAWLCALGEIEALVSLARYGYEHPQDPFPEFLEGPAAFCATGLGHPLIADAARVGNDVEISGKTRVLLVSGSNMSGKSTLLRTVGINTVLAMAGGPVRAARLQISPLQVGASIRVNDSLSEGRSRFFAEIKRLKQLFEPTALPLLFLLDELLQGTNSADRRIGAEGILKALINRAAIGLVSTHDLALTEISDLPPGSLVNVHFQDELENGILKFDFKLRAGVVTKSNGIELMRSIGLEV